MNTSVHDHTAPVVPSIFDHFPKVATQARHAISRRRTAFWSALVIAPVAVGVAFGTTSRRRGLLAGGVAALALGALRVQMARWFTDEPTYEVVGRIGDLEIRNYPARIEARAEVDATDFEQALDAGYSRLAAYISGQNARNEHLPMTTPVGATMRDGRYVISFVMPPARPLGELPHPEDTRIDLRETAGKRVAVVRFHGRFTRANVEAHERELLTKLVDAGLSTRGSVAFEAYDSPATLPLLRRNELWIEIV